MSFTLPAYLSSIQNFIEEFYTIISKQVLHFNATVTLNEGHSQLIHRKTIKSSGDYSLKEKGWEKAEHKPMQFVLA